MFILDASAAAPAATATSATTGAPSATAQLAATSQDAPSPLSGMWVLLVIPVVLYFMMIRPNQKRIKEYEEMIKALRRGDRIVTGGGVIGVIAKIENDDVLVVEIAPEIKIRVMRETISHVITKTAVNDNKADDKPSKKADDKAV